MLILARKVGEAIAIDDHIKVRILELKGGQVKLGIEAPHHVSVHREEIYQKIFEENKKAALDTAVDLTVLSEILQQGTTTKK